MTRRYEPASHVRFMATESGGLLLNLNTNAYYSLSESGVEVWRALAEGLDKATAAARLTQAFEVDVATATADVEDLVREFLEHGLLERHAGSA